MNLNCFTRPDKPLICKRPNFDIKTPLVLIEPPKLLTVDKGTECHVTPDHIADIMVSYLNYEEPTLNKSGSSILEPSAGTGQLINAMLKTGIEYWRICAIEKHYKLCEFISKRFDKLKVNQGDFITDYKQFDNEYDRVICNPPFKNIIKHIDKAYKCLKVGGEAVCLVPITYNKINHEVLEILPSDTFSYCKVNTKIIRITK